MANDSKTKQNLIISLKLLMSSLLIMLILSVAVSVVYVVPFRGISQDITASYLLEASGQIAYQVKLIFEKPINETQQYARNIESIYKNTSRDKMISILLEWYISKPEYMAVYVGFDPWAYDNRDKQFERDVRFVNGAFATYISRVRSDATRVRIESDIRDYISSEKYRIPYETQKSYISKPTRQQISQQDGSYFDMMRISSPILDGEKSIGTVGIDFSMETIVELISGYSVLKNPRGFCSIAWGDGSIIASKDSSLQYKNILNFVPDRTENRILSGILNQKTGKMTLATEFPNGEKTVTGLYKFNIEGTDYSFIIMASLPESDIFHAINESTQNAVMASLFIFVLGLLFFYILIREVVLAPIMEQMKIIEKLSVTDALTGLANRRIFEETLKREWKVALRNKKPIGFLMLDADKFKVYNDTYGHPQGDKLLIALSGVLRRAVHRPSDLSGRLGGEEFGVLLPNTDLSGAIHIAETIRTEVERLRIRVADTGKITTCTVSIGVAVAIPMSNENHESIMKAADEQLYKAKEGGRNRVISDTVENL